MPFAVVAYFDKKSDERIRLLWRGMADIGVDDYLIQIIERIGIIEFHPAKQLFSYELI
ncbi:hypothetical protein [Lachnoclostridium sp.]|uniref:hypothetical protein n=1 Tax=Lachnoclostridium sp. TaxID=2028282 RepID=UPI002897AA90|nr:hypothetical protein [Lachnoclostridium sp.]